METITIKKPQDNIIGIEINDTKYAISTTGIIYKLGAIGYDSLAYPDDYNSSSFWYYMYNLTDLQALIVMRIKKHVENGANV